MKNEEHASLPFAGGIMQHGYQCGMIWGSTLAAGAQAFRLFGPGPQAETMAVRAAQKLVESFRTQNKNINCLEITEIGKSSTAMQMIFYFIIKGGTIGCLRRAGRYAPSAFSEINKTFSENEINTPSSPVSCAAIVAKKLGASDLHTVMAAGFAGGIGLCGGACGALGAAIWINGMKCLEAGADKIDSKNPKIVGAVERFMKCTDYKFECSEIIGRKFADIDDHASYLREGGCSNIIELLTAQ